MGEVSIGKQRNLPNSSVPFKEAHSLGSMKWMQIQRLSMIHLDKTFAIQQAAKHPFAPFYL